ncbi:MAG: proline racemase [Calditrichaeota bacterium]|nr:MAG: proline racemase [Calditrichota bacterium]
MNLKKARSWQPPENWITIKTIDAHTEGEPLRVILSGLPELEGKTILERRQFMQKHLDHLRKALMWEPRGHADMYGCVITPPVTEEADFGVLFLHNEGYSTMCGHGIIGVVKVALETGILPIEDAPEQIAIDTPAGLVVAYPRISQGRVESVAFHNVPSFVLLKDKIVEVPQLGRVTFDVAFGGAFYAFVDADSLNIELTSPNYRKLIELGMAIKHAVMEQFPIEHPFEEDLSFLYGTIFTGSPRNANHHSRHVCIFAEGEVDRSPTGTGVSARLALLYEKGELKVDQTIIIESLIDSTFSGRVVTTTTFGQYPAVIPEVGGRAFITGVQQFCIDPEDPLKYGFFLR